MKKITSLALGLTTSFMLIDISLFAQNCNPNIPIDGGISALLVAGVSYGAKKLYDSRKN